MFWSSKKIICSFIRLNLSAMPHINPFIHFNGNAEEAFTFYQSIFGGEFTSLIRYKDLSNAELFSEKEANKLMHITLPIGKNSLLMASDVPEMFGEVNENENRSKVYISAENKDEAFKLFNALSAGGEIEVPIIDGPQDSYFGMLRDKYGIEWMVNFTKN
jgi:PhnB protein